MYKDSRTDVCIIPCFNVSLHRVWFIFRTAERTFTTAERTFTTAERTFTTAERTFTTAERRNRTAERKTNACSMEMSTGNAK